MIIYCIKNEINDKCYIGQSIYEKRLEEHKYYLRNNTHTNKYLQRSWNKYGKDNFSFDIIENNISTHNKLLEKEKEYIDKYDSYNNGYNLTKGGEGIVGFEHKKETKEKMRETAANLKGISVGCYDLEGNYISKHKSLMEAYRETGVEVANIGRVIRSDENCKLKDYQFIEIDYDNPPKKIEKFRSSHNKYAAKYSKSGRLLEIYDTVKQAAKDNNIPSNTIGTVSDTDYTSGGYMWKTSHKKDFPNKTKPYGDYKERISTYKKVCQYDKQGNFIRTFKSCKHAGLAIGHTSGRRVSSCCTGSRKSAGGYQWRHWEENFPKKISEYNSEHTGKYNIRKVRKYTTDDNFIKEYESLSEAARDVGLKTPTTIGMVCKGKRNTAAGYKWEYSNK